jgi:hypothetical protein
MIADKYSTEEVAKIIEDVRRKNKQKLKQMSHSVIEAPPAQEKSK